MPHNAMADSLMEEVSAFVEENTDAEILDEIREMKNGAAKIALNTELV